MSPEHVPLFAAFAVFFACCAVFATSDPTVNWTLSDLVPKVYDNLKVPQEPGGPPVGVNISVTIMSILAVNEGEQSYSVDMFYKQYWKDNRLNPPPDQSRYPLYLDSSWKLKLWVPDVYFRNALQSSVLSVLSPIMYLEVTNKSEITLTSRMTVKLNCDMQLFNYPQDTQTCFIDIVSMTQTLHHMVLSWDEFKLDEHIYFPKFTVYKYYTNNCSEIIVTNTRSCLRGSMRMVRTLGYYVIRVYAPSFLIVLVSFVGFWVPVLAWPGRVALVVTPLLTLVTMQSQINAEINVSYVVALHIWMMFCIFFVFMALIEYAFAIMYSNLVEDRKALSQETPSAEAGLVFGKEKRSWGHYLKVVLFRVYGSVDWLKAPLTRNKVDYASRIMFPMVYAIFIAIYLFVFVFPWLATRY